MNFLFIYPSPGVLGGIETLISRMSQSLLAKGHTVSIITAHDRDWKKTLPVSVPCIALGDRFGELYYYFHTKRLWNSFNLPKPDVIKAFDLASSWVACELAEIIGNNCKVISGMYASFLLKWYYAPETLGKFDAVRLYLKNYLECIPASARLVCGADQVEELEEMYREKCMLWPIPIDTSRFEAAARKPKWGKIVSVGRLCAMKEYNFYMIDVLRELRQRGHDVSWTVYGGGEYEAEMRQRIEAAGMDKFVSMAGSVPYHKFWQILSDAHVFVGMGTSMLEAAMFKVPNVYATAYDREGLTYGPMYRMPAGSIGPGIKYPPKLKVVDEIERILRLSPADYDAEQELSYQHVQRHQIDATMEQFLQMVQVAEPAILRRGLYLANYPRWLAQKATNRLIIRREPGHPTAPLYSTQG